MHNPKPWIVGVLALAGCGGGPPPEVVAPELLGETPDEEPSIVLDGPFASLDEAPAPHGFTRSTLLGDAPGGPFLEAVVLEFTDPSQAEPARCAVGLRLERGWYVGASFQCERRSPDDPLTIETLAIDLTPDALPPEVLLWYIEKTSAERTRVIVCRAPSAAAPVCAAPVARER